MIPHVFLSYTWADSGHCDRLEAELLARNMRVWRDKRNIRNASNWDTSIEKALTSGLITHVVYIASTNSIRDNSFCRDELLYANQLGIPTLVVRVYADDKFTLPIFVSRKTPIDLFPDYEYGLTRLVSELQIETPTMVGIEIALPEGEISPEQSTIAHVDSDLVRLIAGPGTGKTSVIIERVRYLISEKKVPPQSIFVISFTRASTNELKKRLIEYCSKNNVSDADLVNVSTLHSLALKILRSKHLLRNYPSAPKVLDDWETRNIVVAELAQTLKRDISDVQEILRRHVAFLSGSSDAGEKMPADVASTYNIMSRTYSCILKGELVRTCVDRIAVGDLDPVSILGAQHLIVDEYQDLNSVDIGFVNAFIVGGAAVFVAGDDDQSIYSFRYADRNGLADFGAVGDRLVDRRELKISYRCSPMVLEAAKEVLTSYQGTRRIPKHLESVYEGTELQGIVRRWTFSDATLEAEAIALSCKELISRGLQPKEILVLLANREIYPATKGVIELEQKLAAFELPYKKLPPKRPLNFEPWCRFLLALSMIVCDEIDGDYVSRRTLLGMLNGVGISTLDWIRRLGEEQNVNYLGLFYGRTPVWTFQVPQAARALEAAQTICGGIGAWSKTDSVGTRMAELMQIVTPVLNKAELSKIREFLTSVPSETTFYELAQILRSDTNDAPFDSEVDTPDNSDPLATLKQEDTNYIRLSTIHKAKGLGAKVVFIPGLEDGIIPNEHSTKRSGGLSEQARVLYVAMSRAQVALIISHAHRRREFGRYKSRTRSEFLVKTNRNFETRLHGLNSEEADAIVQEVKAIDFRKPN